MWRSYVIGPGFLVVYLLTTFRFLAPVVHYQLDYTYISEVRCLNRDKPELQCQGKCQLRRNLARLNRHQQQKEALQRLASVYQPVEDVPRLLLLLSAPPAATAAETPAMPAPHISTAILSAPFHPPRQA
ncbi:hypothetical protein [Pontibacter flavimaris]|uniref:Uncharacterized protein n=1 Tax=Pontibacter flavimaris TaxID=1797110 RepID=A0A1Q5PD18_9BACT|nr:hypothetical protein [Pontibacter flavimaris]OKL40130.1 hypothetical protein A3841_17435 [Pontibacter flavimaris]